MIFKRCIVITNKTKKTIILVANRGFAIWNSRYQLITKLKDKGYHIVVVVSHDEYGEKLTKICDKVIYTNIQRGGFSLASDYKFYQNLKKIYKFYQPILVQHYNSKPVILGSLAARNMHPQVRIVNTITGLGHAFIKSKILEIFVSFGYLFALKCCSEVVFQNQDDMNLFKKKKLIPKETGIYIPGSGVNLKKFTPQHRKDNNVVNVYFIGRLIWQKGLREFLQVAEEIKKEYFNVHFYIVGEIDKNHPDSIDLKEFKKFQENNIVTYEGYKRNIQKVYANADLILFLSYREGFPRVVLEASASEVPTIGFNVPGVKEAIIDGKTGFLVDMNDFELLISKVVILIKNKSLRKTFGINARKFIGKNFSISKITEQYINLYKSLW